LQGRGVAQFRDGRHAFGGEQAAALQLPVLVLLQQHRPHQASDRGVVGEDADDAGAALGFLSVVKPLQRLCVSAAGPQTATAQARPVLAGLRGRLGPGKTRIGHFTLPEPARRCMLAVGWFSLWSARRLLTERFHPFFSTHSPVRDL
jgi:hypothetical protein